MVFEQSLQRFKDKILPASSVLIVPHDFPDPDSIGAAMGVQLLLKHLGVEKCDIAFAGFIGRAENRAMVELLEIQHLNLNKIDTAAYDKIITVDTLPNNGNVSINDVSIVDVVIDHHPVMELEKHPNTLYEIHTDVGATSTLVCIYLTLENVLIPAKVATALFYGIKTDTNDMARNCHDVDISCYKKLFDLIEHKTLSHIESPQREKEYFSLLHSAAEDLKFYETVAYSHLGIVTVPDYVPEMADIFHSMKELEWIVCSAIFGDLLIFSIRSKTDMRAGNRARRIARALGGSGGGHPTMSAGRIPLNGDHPEEVQERFYTVVQEVFEIAEITPTQLVNNQSLK
jgi:nanoRNase/pAp phosphatase (c-di-AMP/oligoRNAs hydrolase)